MEGFGSHQVAKVGKNHREPQKKKGLYHHTALEKGPQMLLQRERV